MTSNLTADDLTVVARQLGRRPRDVTGIAVRCPFGHPTVIETAPVLSDGTPNPTLLYVTCPVLTAAISRVEAGGGVRALRAACAADDTLRTALDRVTALYRQRRQALAAERATRGGDAGVWVDGAGAGAARPEAGIGGPSGPDRASCLHAYAAALLAVRSGWLSVDGTPSDVQRIWSRLYPLLEDVWCRDERCAAALLAQRRAVVDVGTISVRLLVADVLGDRVDTIVRRAEITRMGEGLRQGGRLRPAAAERTARVIGSLVEEARGLEPVGIILAGTSATREAEDGRDFLLSLGERLGVSAVMLSGRQEAEAAYIGATLDVGGDPTVIDIGGGSTELSRRRGIRFETVSLDTGASKATERWMGAEPPSELDIEGVLRESRALFGPHVARFAGPGGRLVGVAGTVTTIACLASGLDKYDRDAIHLRLLTVEEVREQLERLAGMTLEQRAALGCVQAGRAPVIVAGAAVLLAAMETLGFEELTVSERDLLDGLALQGPW